MLSLTDIGYILMGENGTAKNRAGNLRGRNHRQKVIDIKKNYKKEFFIISYI